MHNEASQKSLKSQLRKQLRRRRAAVNEDIRKRWDWSINQALVDLARHTCPLTVAAYLAFDGEPDLAPALTEMDRRGIRLALPVVQHLPGKSAITFHAWKSGDALKANRYGIAEPVEAPLVPVPDIDLMLVPLVGWDKQGGRLGMGASFYDRMFQPFAGLEKPARMGVAYELQKVSAVPCEPWDIRLHGILTENGWFTFQG
jgi:5-formyltetrahydrofolate cyclo-ligase